MSSENSLPVETAEALTAAAEAATRDPSALSLIPPAVVIIFAVWLKRPILALVLGALSGMLLISPTGTLGNFAETTLRVMQDETIGWSILVCGVFGAMVALLVRTGVAFEFGRLAETVAKRRKPSLLVSYFLGLLILVDDYLNALAVGGTMKRLTDKYQVSREML